MKKKISIHLIATGITVLAFAVMLLTAPAKTASAADNWKDSFDDICSKTQSSDNLSTEELAALVDKADKLMPEIQRSDDPAKKVYLQRLKKCRSLFQFMIESRQPAGK